MAEKLTDKDGTTWEAIDINPDEEWDYEKRLEVSALILRLTLLNKINAA